MPIRKSDISNNQLLDNSESVVSLQNKVLDASLKKMTDVKDTSIGRLGGIKTPVTYYRRNTSSKNDYVANTASFNSIDPNLNLFHKIKNFILLFNDLSGSIEGENLLSIEQEGECVVLPDTIQPGVGDYFVAKIITRFNLYKVTDIETSSFEGDSGYTIKFNLVKDNVDPLNLESITDNIETTFEFQYEHVGTKFRSIFREDEFKIIERMKDFYFQLAETYNSYFYDKKTSTYYLPSDFIDPETYNAGVFTEVTVGENSPIRDSLLESVSSGVNMFDPVLVKFLKDNGIFNVDKKHMYVSTYAEFGRHEYRNSIFNTIEEQNYKFLKMRYQKGKYITYATPAVVPILYGSVILSHSTTLEDDTFDIFPKDFAFRIRSTPTPIDFNSGVYSSKMDEIVELIVSYINKHDVDLLMWLDKIFKQVDDNMEPEDVGENRYEIYYIYPLLAYVIKDVIFKLSGYDFS